MGVAQIKVVVVNFKDPLIGAITTCYSAQMMSVYGI